MVDIYVEFMITSFTFLHMRTEMCGMFVYKHTETIEYVKN